ncbi:Hsp20/alpha crystallin family protein [Variovorax sp. OV700]|uniref:Hsp20/alpha crystallin family protein n=1 Tax=Variovorax sp. OV700 TaxID=1882826 RepID=UPI0008882151|nr:Hsp20/alpha crystallin family protein [Variovorax sp. OV700]SDH42037.1 Molecular chaperone IbpA, HSP20 family [Variovorax sp. OV700]
MTTNTSPRVAERAQLARKEDGARYSDAALTPPVDVIEDSGGITLYADLPGVSRDKLGLHVASDTLTIEAESDLSVPEGLESSHTEVGLGRFRRVFTLSKELDTGAISAELKQGVLKLRIPKAQHAQPRRIEIQAS